MRVWLVLAAALLGGCLRVVGQMPPGGRDAAQVAVDPQASGRAAANEALAKGDYAGALTLLLALVAENPKDARLLYDLGYTQDALEQGGAAESSYRGAIALDAGLVEAHLGLGLMLARAGKAAEARGELTVAAGAEGAAPALRAQAYRAMARLELMARPRNTEAAREDLLAALKLSPETPDDTLMAAELAEAAKDSAGAEKAYRRVLAATPGDPAATAGLAQVLGHEGATEAEELLRGALAAHPGDGALTAQLASLYGTQGKYAEAAALMEAMHAATPGDGNVTRMLAHIYAESGKPEKAEPLYAGLLATAPEAALLDDRADALIKLRRYAEAEALLERAVADRAGFATAEGFGLAAAHLAFAAANNNDPQTTLRALQLRATVLPQTPSSLFLAATAHDKLHDFKQAADLYKEFLAAASGKFPDEEFEARHRVVAIEKRR